MQKKCPFTQNRDVSLLCDQILCLLNGGVPWIGVSQRRSSLYPCGEGLGRGYETCEAMTSDIVLPNVSTFLHVFSATLT